MHSCTTPACGGTIIYALCKTLHVMAFGNRTPDSTLPRTSIWCTQNFCWQTTTCSLTGSSEVTVTSQGNISPDIYAAQQPQPCTGVLRHGMLAAHAHYC